MLKKKKLNELKKNAGPNYFKGPLKRTKSIKISSPRLLKQLYIKTDLNFKIVN